LKRFAPLTFVLLCSLARAAEPDKTELVVTFGAERSNQSLSGASTLKPEWTPSFGLDYRDGRFFASTKQGIGYDLYKAHGLTVFGAGAFMPGRKEGKARDNPRLVGMGRIKTTGLILLGAAYAPFEDFIHLHATQMIATDRAQGSSTHLGATIGFPIWGPVNGYLDVGAQHADAKHAQTFYGVTPAQAARSGNRVYTPKSGWVGSDASVGVNWEIDKQWSLNAAVGRHQLRGVAVASPLFAKRIQPTASLTMSYSF
jgi:MipA family protein